MATKKHKKEKRFFDDEAAQKSDFAALAEHAKENPLIYTAGAVFLVVCALAGALYRISSAADEREAITSYARALETTNPALQATEMERLLDDAGSVAPLALYMGAESSFKARDMEKARANYERLRTEFPDFPSVPDAVEGLGFIAEESGDFESALVHYTEVSEKWGSSFAGRRQPLNMGRCQEELGDLENAIKSYQSQQQLFPGSILAMEAAAAEARLRASNPELFPELPTAEEETDTAPPLLDLSDLTSDAGNAETPVESADLSMDEVSGESAESPADQ